MNNPHSNLPSCGHPHRALEKSLEAGRGKAADSPLEPPERSVALLSPSAQPRETPAALLASRTGREEISVSGHKFVTAAIKKKKNRDIKNGQLSKAILRLSGILPIIGFPFTLELFFLAAEQRRAAHRLVGMHKGWRN